MLKHLASMGEVSLRRAYGDWSREALKGWIQPLQAHAFRPIQQCAPVKGKNATDMALVIEAMDLFYTQRPDALAIASSDGDFAPLALRLRERGVSVYGLGEAKAPSSFREACTRFFELGNAPKTALAAIKTASNLPALSLAQIMALQSAVAASTRADGWATLAAAGSNVRHFATLNPKDFGARNFTALFAATGRFVIARAADGITYIADAANEQRSPAPAH